MAITITWPNETTLYRGKTYLFKATGSASMSSSQQIFHRGVYLGEWAIPILTYANYIFTGSGDVNVTLPLTLPLGLTVARAIYDGENISENEFWDYTSQAFAAPYSKTYTIAALPAPSIPSSITVPAVINPNTAFNVTWPTSTNADSYYLERQINGGSWTVVASANTTRSYADNLPTTTTSVRYRVRAYNSSGYSAFKESNTINLTFSPTVFVGSNGALGTFGMTAPSISYSVTNPYNYSTAITETLNGSQLRKFTASLGTSYTPQLPTWLNLANGNYTLVVNANDGKNSVDRTITFTKTQNIIKLDIGNRSYAQTPFPADDRPTMGIISLNGSIPAEAQVTVRVTNNAYDASPYWQDISSQVRPDSRKFMFENSTKTASQWGVAIEVTINRGSVPAGTAINLTSVGGNFR